MSYVVDVILVPPPDAWEAALALRQELAEARDARLKTGAPVPYERPSEPMKELHRRLTARFPCLNDDPDGPWSDGPLINNFGQRIATLGIVGSRLAEVLPFLIGTANDMGFWVLDGQGAVVHLPGGSKLRPAPPLPPRQPWWRFWAR